MEMEELQVEKGIRVRTRTGWQSMTAGAVADAHRSSANPDSLKAAGMAPRQPSRQHADPRRGTKVGPKTEQGERYVETCRTVQV